MRTTIALLLCAIGAAPAAAETVFVGSMQSVAVSNCKDYGSGWDFRAIYHPKIAGNMAFSGLTLIDNGGARNYVSDKGFSEGRFVAVTGGGIGWSAWSWKGSKLRITRSQPEMSRVGPTTDQLVMTIEIQKPDSDPGNGSGPCVATFHGVFYRDF